MRPLAKVASDMGVVDVVLGILAMVGICCGIGLAMAGVIVARAQHRPHFPVASVVVGTGTALAGVLVGLLATVLARP